MKNLVVIGGPMGVGKTEVSRCLQKYLAPAAFLDGDWCWDMQPFRATPETKEMVQENIAFMLRSFLRCSQYENVVFCWVLPGDEVWEELQRRIGAEVPFDLHRFTLLCGEENLRARLERDLCSGTREDPDVVQRSLGRLADCRGTSGRKIWTDGITAEEAARKIAREVTGVWRKGTENRR